MSSPDSQSHTPEEYAALRRNMIVATPFMLLVPVAFALAFILSGTSIRPMDLAFGAGGWLAALVLRAPVSLALLRLLKDPERTQPWVVGASGPLEELVRLLVLILVGRNFSTAVSVGLGWATIEVAYTVITGFLVLGLLQKTDEQSLQARDMLAAQGMLRTTGPALGIVERIGASALHIGFTLIVAWSGIAVIATMLAHSATNLTLVRTFRSHPVATEVALVILGLGTLATGIVVQG